jgi:hypothetical protein
VIDLRHGILRAPVGETPLLGRWEFALKDTYLENVIDYFDKKAIMVSNGIDSLNPLEHFAVNVLMMQYEHRNGKIKKEDLTSD